MDRRDELLRAEAEGWEELSELISGLEAPHMVQSGLTEEWTVKDLLAHLAAWLREATDDLERIRGGTYQSREWSDAETDAANREIYEAFRGADLEAVRADLLNSRDELLRTFRELPEVAGDAEDVFRTEAPEHYAEHMEDLHRFVGRAAGV